MGPRLPEAGDVRTGVGRSERAGADAAARMGRVGPGREEEARDDIIRGRRPFLFFVPVVVLSLPSLAVRLSGRLSPPSLPLLL